MGSPDQGKFGGGAGDFRYGTQPKVLTRDTSHDTSPLLIVSL